jgi:hypothetical protein
MNLNPLSAGFSVRRHPERAAGLLMIVLALHVSVLYGLWRYQVIFLPEAPLTLMGNLTNP